VVKLLALVDRMEEKLPEMSRYDYDPIFTLEDLGISR